MSIITAGWAALNGAVLVGMTWFGISNFDQAYAIEQVYLMSDKEKECLRENIYWESRSQSNMGQLAVANVTLNRVDDPAYPDTICEVVYQPKQFSWTNNEVEYNLDNKLEKEAWISAYYNAYFALIEHELNIEDFTKGALMFHADYVDPYWSASYNKTVKIDNHIFYTR